MKARSGRPCPGPAHGPSARAVAGEIPAKLWELGDMMTAFQAIPFQGSWVGVPRQGVCTQTMFNLLKKKVPKVARRQILCCNMVGREFYLSFF